MSFTAHKITVNPSVQIKLREEIDKVKVARWQEAKSKVFHWVAIFDPVNMY